MKDMQLKVCIFDCLEFGIDFLVLILEELVDPSIDRLKIRFMDSFEDD